MISLDTAIGLAATAAAFIIGYLTGSTKPIGVEFAETPARGPAKIIPLPSIEPASNEESWSALTGSGNPEAHDYEAGWREHLASMEQSKEPKRA